jgi:intracellular septation protein A
LIAVANVFIARECNLATWAWFISFGAVGAKAVAFGL